MSEKSKRISFPKEVREYVFQRDNHQCKSCGQTTKLSIVSFPSLQMVAMILATSKPYAVRVIARKSTISIRDSIVG